MRDPKRLKVFQLADELAVAVYEATKGFPKDEWFGLRSQIRRAAVSIPSNIVEGCARSSEKEYLHFLDIAYGSALEVEYQLSLAHRLGYLDAEIHTSLNKAAAQTAKALNGLICSLRKT